MKTFMTHIYEADNTFFEGELISLVVPVADGLYGILADHQNTVMAVSTGMVKYTLPDGTEKIAAVSDGMLRVENNDVLILVDAAEHPEEIDETREREREAAMREAMLVARRERVPVSDDDLDFYVRLVDGLDPDGMPSMRQDSLAGRPTEVEFFAGTVVRKADALGLDVPVNRRLYRQIREMEQTR
jgi:F0F1-type ATP synthase epsilon subunit